jgi:HAD superfamily hydrolase (TIGR01509 family)
LFDMDGLLVDTEPLWLETETEVMARLGAPWTPRDQQELLGGSMEQTVTYMLARARLAPGQLPSREQVATWMLDGMLRRAAAGRVAVRPGAPELLSSVAAAGMPYALVTSSQRPLAEAVLDSTGFRFPVVVTGDDVTALKPNPEPYLLAARLLGVDPVRCAALEDSPAGVASASAAGCLVVAVPSILPVEPAPGRLTVRSLTELSLETLRALAYRLRAS